jgi:hypothetical protein
LNQIIGSLAEQKAPQHILAALEVLQFQNSSADRISFLSRAERRRFLEWCDVRQLTLMLPHLYGSRLPAWAREVVLQKATRYEQRFERLKRELVEIVEAFDGCGLEFVLLKGLSHAPALTPDARMRTQGDIDLWLTGSSVYKARDVLRTLGYVPLLDSKSRHLAPMGRPSDWEWKGDLFDPGMPISVELHYELWSEHSEYIAVPELEQFWARKRLRDFDGHKINVLCDEDLLGFAALHLLLHLIHGELPLQRAWEIARFLDTHVSDEFFWTSWRDSHPLALRQLETSIFYLVTNWFHCHSRQELAADVQGLPVLVKSWLEECFLAPLVREWAPNKLEIGLHLAFISNRKDKARILFRRLVPTSLPSFVDRAVSEASPMTKLVKHCRQIRLLASRLVRHAITLFPSLVEGLRWLWLPKS